MIDSGEGRGLKEWVSPLKTKVCRYWGNQKESRNWPTSRDVYFVWLRVEILTLCLELRRSAVGL
jgi:hypothetical protein